MAGRNGRRLELFPQLFVAPRDDDQLDRLFHLEDCCVKLLDRPDAETAGELEHHLVEPPSATRMKLSRLLGFTLITIGLTLLTLVAIGFFSSPDPAAAVGVTV